MSSRELRGILYPYGGALKWERDEPLIDTPCQLCDEKTFLTPYCVPCAGKAGISLRQTRFGLGVFTDRSRKKGEIIGYSKKGRRKIHLRYDGEPLRDKVHLRDAERLHPAVLDQQAIFMRYGNCDGKYIMEIDGVSYDALLWRSWVSMLNDPHPGRANVTLGPKGLVATQNIAANEELLLSYVAEPDGHYNFDEDPFNRGCKIETRGLFEWANGQGGLPRVTWIHHRHENQYTAYYDDLPDGAGTFKRPRLR